MPTPSTKYANHPSLVALGGAIRAARKQVGLSQEELAHQAGLDRAYMSSIERGLNNIAMINLLKISSALNVKGSDLLEAAKL